MNIRHYKHCIYVKRVTRRVNNETNRYASFKITPKKKQTRLLLSQGRLHKFSFWEGVEIGYSSLKSPTRSFFPSHLSLKETKELLAPTERLHPLMMLNIQTLILKK